MHKIQGDMVQVLTASDMCPKKRRCPSLSAMWIETESRWCEEANPFGFDIEDERETKPAGQSQEAAKASTASWNAQLIGRRPLAKTGTPSEYLSQLDRRITELDRRIADMKRARDVSYEHTRLTIDRLRAKSSLGRSDIVRVSDMIESEVAANERVSQLIEAEVAAALGVSPLQSRHPPGHSWVGNQDVLQRSSSALPTRDIPRRNYYAAHPRTSADNGHVGCSSQQVQSSELPSWFTRGLSQSAAQFHDKISSRRVLATTGVTNVISADSASRSNPECKHSANSCSGVAKGRLVQAH